MTQADQSLAPFPTNFRGELQGAFGSESVFEIHVLFNKRPGLRHDVAHGKMSAGRCFSAGVIYACWMIFHITAFPLLEHWDETVSVRARSQFGGQKAARDAFLRAALATQVTTNDVATPTRAIDLSTTSARMNSLKSQRDAWWLQI